MSCGKVEMGCGSDYVNSRDQHVTCWRDEMLQHDCHVLRAEHEVSHRNREVVSWDVEPVWNRPRLRCHDAVAIDGDT